MFVKESHIHRLFIDHMEVIVMMISPEKYIRGVFVCTKKRTISYRIYHIEKMY